MKSVAAIALALLVCLAPAPSPAGGAGARAPDRDIPDRDRDRAREGLMQGRFVSLESILDDARRRYPGRILEIELDDDEYEVEILTDDGRKVELEYDARTGRLVDVDFDD